MLLSIGVVIFFALLFMKLAPHYMDNWKIQAALETVTSDGRVNSMTRRQVIQEMKNTLYIDYGEQIVDLNESLLIQKDKGVVHYSIDYEVVVHLAANVSALLNFKNQTDVMF